MKFKRRFQVKAPLEIVARFHSQSASMGAITPPPIITQIHQAPEELTEGDEMVFTLWLGPLPVRWLARIEGVSRVGFTDRQIRGPMRHWTHTHSFTEIDPSTTEVRDEIELALRRHPLWFAVGLGMWVSLPLLFAYRGWKTKRLLERK